MLGNIETEARVLSRSVVRHRTVRQSLYENNRLLLQERLAKPNHRHLEKKRRICVAPLLACYTK
jgi:hypothetical protein